MRERWKKYQTDVAATEIPAVAAVAAACCVQEFRARQLPALFLINFGYLSIAFERKKPQLILPARELCAGYVRSLSYGGHLRPRGMDGLCTKRKFAGHLIIGAFKFLD